MIITIADASSFIGSVWFAALALVVGYVGGNLVPISALASILKKKSGG